MSLVGPRATTCDEMNRLAEIAPWGLFDRWERAIRMAKPAIVSLGSGEGYMHPEYYSPDSKLRQMELDIWYAENATLATDIAALKRTGLHIATSGMRAVRRRKTR